MKKLSTLMLLALCLILAPAARAEQTVIQTQQSTDGEFEISLLDVKQKNDVVTIKASVKNTTSNKQKIYLCYESSYFIDPKENKKYMPLHDTKDHTIGGPRDQICCSNGGLNRELENGQQALFWLKFPAPVSETSEVDFFFPRFLPLEGVPIQK
jgi:hypothetical protein